MKSRNRILACALVVVAGGSLTRSTSVYAGDLDGTFFTGLGNTQSFQQTSNAMPASPTGVTMSFSARGSSPTCTSAVLTYPGAGSPLNLPKIFNNEFQYISASYATESALHVDFPFGSYTTTGSTATESTAPTFNYSADVFAPATPYLTNFSSLSGFNPTQSQVVAFPAFTPSPNTLGGNSSLTIFKGVGNVVLYQEFDNPGGTTSTTIPANTLSPNTPYTFQFSFTQYVDAFDASAQQSTAQAFVLTDNGSFTTGVPEPTAIPTLLAGIGLLSLPRRNRCKRE